MNGTRKYFYENLISQNADLNYVYYNDSFSEIASYSDPDIWFDSYVPDSGSEYVDCIHMPSDQYDRWYGRYLSSWFTNYTAPNVTITNTDITNTTIR